MCTRRIFGLAVVALLTLGGRARAYTNQWAAHIEGGEEVARQVAEDYGFRYLGKVSTSTPRALKRSRALPAESEDFIKEESRSSRRRGEICETDVLTSLPNEKFRATRALAETLKIPRHLLITGHFLLNSITSCRSPRISGSDRTSQPGNWLFLQHNIDEGIVRRLKRWRSTQSSCEGDGWRGSRRCIEDHQQSAGPCGRTSEGRSDDGAPAESYRGSSRDLLSHREYYRFVESACPISGDKPARYSDQRACDSRESEVRGTEVSGLKPIKSTQWTCGKSAMERVIYHTCTPRACGPSFPTSRRERTCSPPRMPRDCSARAATTRDKPRRVVTAHSMRVRCEPPCSEEIRTSKQDASPRKIRAPRTHPAPDTHECGIKPDPPPPSYQHWTENPPSYCNRCPKKVTRSPVQPSPMIFVPRKGRKSRAKETAAKASADDVQEDCVERSSENKCGRTDAKVAIVRATSRSRKSSCGESPHAVSLEDKCGDPSTLPGPASRTESKFRWFSALTRSGRCAEEPAKVFALSNASDCEPNVASLKYRLSKCPPIKEMWNVGGPPKRKPLFRPRKKTKRLKARRDFGGEERKVGSHDGWTGQRYKVRLKIFQKANGRLDPGLPRIVELRQPRGEPSPLPRLLESTADEGDIPLRLKSPCPYRPRERPRETKSYPTKMEESRAEARRECQENRRRKKYC